MRRRKKVQVDDGNLLSKENYQQKKEAQKEQDDISHRLDKTEGRTKERDYINKKLSKVCTVWILRRFKNCF